MFPNKARFSYHPLLSLCNPRQPAPRPPHRVPFPLMDSARTLSAAVQSFDTQRSLASWHCGDRATPSSIHCYRATTKTAKPSAPNLLSSPAKSQTSFTTLVKSRINDESIAVFEDLSQIRDGRYGNRASAMNSAASLTIHFHDPQVKTNYLIIKPNY